MLSLMRPNSYEEFADSPILDRNPSRSALFIVILHLGVHVSCEDIRAFMLPAMRHRVLLNFEGEADRIDPDVILTEIMNDVPEPTE
jgi:MoxR-like ATPase